MDKIIEETFKRYSGYAAKTGGGLEIEVYRNDMDEDSKCTIVMSPVNWPHIYVKDNDHVEELKDELAEEKIKYERAEGDLTTVEENLGAAYSKISTLNGELADLRSQLKELPTLKKRVEDIENSSLYDFF